jgi:hypothetical protein
VKTLADSYEVVKSLLDYSPNQTDSSISKDEWQDWANSRSTQELLITLSNNYLDTMQDISALELDKVKDEYAFNRGMLEILERIIILIRQTQKEEEN